MQAPFEANATLIHRSDRTPPTGRDQTKEEPSWNMMGDKFQLGPFKDVIVVAPQRVTPVTNFF